MTTPAAGHNNPPSQIDNATVGILRLGSFLKSNFVIDHINATEAAALVDTSRRVMKDLDDERRSKVDPLNEQVRDINASYKPVRETFEKLLDTLKDRLSDFARREEAKRRAEALRLAKEAEAAERAARAAEEAERLANLDAVFGAEVDLVAPTVAADQAFAAFEKADRTAARAEREVPVRLATPMGRAVSLRTKETLHVDDWQLALRDMGLTEGIREAILTAARAYRKLHDKLPAGVRAETTQGI